MSKLSQTAAQSGIDKLFHYQRFDPDDEKDRSRLADVLTNRRIYCSDPEDFNDPWDSKPFFNPESLKDSPYTSAIEEWCKSNPDMLLAQQLQGNPESLNLMLRHFSSKIPELVYRGNFRVYSLSTDHLHQLMWSHYTNGHRGICLEFSVKDSLFLYALEVRYQELYPSLNVNDTDDRVNGLLIKSVAWQYEQEYRLICPCFQVGKDHPLRLSEGKYFHIGDALKSITVGCRADFANVRKFIEDHAPTLNVRQTEPAPDRYELTINPHLW